MKTIFKVKLILSIVAMSLAGHTYAAKVVKFHGSACRPASFSQGSINYEEEGIRNSSSGNIEILCPIYDLFPNNGLSPKVEVSIGNYESKSGRSHSCSVMTVSSYGVLNKTFSKSVSAPNKAGYKVAISNVAKKSDEILTLKCSLGAKAYLSGITISYNE